MLTEAQFQVLCATCDSLLDAPDATATRIGIPWLHVTREHPAHLTPYEGLFSGLSGWRIDRMLVVRGAVAMVRTLLSVARSALRGRRGPPPSDLDVLFVSHLLNPAAAGSEDDFYFSDWPRVLSQRGLKVGVVLLNHVGEKGVALERKWDGSDIPRIVMRPSVSLGTELRLAVRVWRESRRLRLTARKEQDPFRRAVASRAATLALSGSTRTTLRIGEEVHRIVAHSRPSAIVITHEGYAWERVALAAARRARPDIKAIGYQHSLVFRLQHGLLRNLRSENNPDHILASGEDSRGRLSSAQRLRGISVTVGGSTRGLSDPADRSDRLVSARLRGLGSGRACLVLPEGIDSECVLLFGLALEVARAMPELPFIWRLHPIIDWKQFVTRNPGFNDLPANVNISVRSLQDDLAMSDWALYRGTTAIIQAVGAGVMPVYVSVPGEMTIDPFWRLSNSVPRVSSADEFISNLKRADSWVNAMSMENAKSLNRLSRSLFAPRNVTALVEAISNSRSA